MHGRFLVTASTEHTDISDPTLLADAGAIPILVSSLKQSNEASLIHSSSGTNVILPQNILVAIKCILKDAEKDRQSHLLTHAGGSFLPTLDAMRHWKDYEGVEGHACAVLCHFIQCTVQEKTCNCSSRSEASS
jgi:hypothetical protein